MTKSYGVRKGMEIEKVLLIILLRGFTDCTLYAGTGTLIMDQKPLFCLYRRYEDNIAQIHHIKF